MAASADFWGNIDTEEVVRTPVSILKEQAKLLGAKTKFVLEARVETSSNGNGWFRHRLLLIAPALDDYVYELLVITNPIELYPVYPDDAVDGSPPTRADALNNEGEFLQWLSKRLASKATHRVITNLISQSRS